MAISLSIVATPPRVASRIARTPGTASSRPAIRPFSGAVSDTTSASMSSSPRASMIVMPWSPIGPDTMIASPGWASATPRETSRESSPDPGGVDVAAVGLAPLHDLRVPGDDADPRRSSGVAHGRGDPDQVGDGEALLEDEARRQVQRRRAGHGQVVDRAVDGQVTDVAAGEEQRRHDVGVGGEREPGARPDGDSPRRRPRAARAAGCGTRRGRSPRSGCCVALPPAPCDMVIRSSRTRGRLRLARSIRSSTCCSRSATGSTRRPPGSAGTLCRRRCGQRPPRAPAAPVRSTRRRQPGPWRVSRRS